MGVEDSDVRKKLYFLIQRLQTVSFGLLIEYISHNDTKILQYKPPLAEAVSVTQEDDTATSSPDRVQIGEVFG